MSASSSFISMKRKFLALHRGDAEGRNCVEWN